MKKIKKYKSDKPFKERFFNNHIIRRLVTLANSISQDKISAYSSEAALFTIISFFPFLMLFFILLSFTSLPPSFVIKLIDNSFPEEIIELIMTIIDQLNNTSKTVISITALTALWSASRGFTAIVKGFDVIYKSDNKTNIILHRLYAILYTIGFAVLLTITLGLLVFGNKIYIWIIKHFPFIKDLALLILGMRTTVLLVILFVFFLLMYTILPNRKTSLIYELPGAIIASFGWVGFSYCFSFYIDNITNISYIYGSLSTIVLLLLWVYFCMYILFIGAEINHFLNNYLQEKYSDSNSRFTRLRNFFNNLFSKKKS